jgi:hypothetical protein
MKQLYSLPGEMLQDRKELFNFILKPITDEMPDLFDHFVDGILGAYNPLHDVSTYDEHYDYICDAAQWAIQQHETRFSTHHGMLQDHFEHACFAGRLNHLFQDLACILHTSVKQAVAGQAVVVTRLAYSPPWSDRLFICCEYPQPNSGE